MIAIVEPVVVIRLGWQQLRKFYERGTFGRLFSKTALKRLKDAIDAKSFLEKLACIQLQCTLCCNHNNSPFSMTI
jgi:CRP-like cAMP-binding protein